MDRRNKSVDRYYAQEEVEKKQAEEAIRKMEKATIQDQMSVERHQRKHIKNEKQNQLERAKDDLFADLDAVNEMDARLTQVGRSQMNSHGQAPSGLETETAEQIRANYIKGKGEDIFGDEDCTNQGDLAQKYQPGEQIGQCTVEEIVDEEEEPQIKEYVEPAAPEVQHELPGIRQEKTETVGFTEKKFAHLPARESQHKEAPYPKSKKMDKQKNDEFVNIEDKDPLWLKDKGDHFYRRNDFHSAINAYSKALENDKEFLMARLNRATTFIRMRAYEACVKDCDDIELQIKGLKDAEREEDADFYGKMLARAYLKRGAAQAWLSQHDAAVVDLQRAMEYKGVFGEHEIQTIQRDIAACEVRKKSQEVKLQGDIFFARNMLTESLEQYMKALELDAYNEYALSNIGVIHMRRQDYENCLKYTNEALSMIENFQADTKEFQRDNILEIKLLQRRSKCLEVQEKYEESKVDLDKAQLLDPQNPIVRASLKRVQDKLNTIRFDEYRTQGNEFLKQKKFPNAMEYYDKCLRITRKATTLDNVAIYVNKIACLLSLEKFNQVVAECNDAMRLIKNYKNRHDGKHSPEDIKRIGQMELRLAVRKGNAQAKLGKASEAIAEYEKALQLDPTNASVKKDLDMLRKTT